jgi:hypothetical protein
MSADHASQKLLEWLDDPEVPYRVRAEIAQDLLDRAGLASTQAIKIVPAEDDPVMRFFEEAFSLDSLAIWSGLASPWRTARLSSFPKVKGAAPRVPRSRLVQHFHLAVIF